jgi:hypothetical protein
MTLVVELAPLNTSMLVATLNAVRAFLTIGAILVGILVDDVVVERTLVIVA